MWLLYNVGMVTREKVYEVLAKVMDPELHIDIVSLGLIYGVEVKDKSIRVTMTLTTPGCPLAPIIDKLVREAMAPLGDFEVKLNLVWEPVWSKDMMSEEGKLKLGIV